MNVARVYGSLLLLFALAASFFVAALWVVDAITDNAQVQLTATFLLGLGFLLIVITVIVAAFAAMRLTSSSAALGLPEGSIRAIIALVLILVFVVMAIFLFNAVFLADGVGPAARNNAATQVLAVLGTLVSAIAAFYFGTSAVTTGSVAATAAIGATQAQGPAAITKGSRLEGDDYALVGIVNPHARGSSYFFEYGRESSYGKTTPVQSAGSGNAEEVVEAKVPRGDVVHLRIVAFNDAGMSHGEDAKVDKVFNEDGTDPGGS